MMRLFILFTFCLTLFANLSNAQEICNNNLDDDGDGQVDCLDGDCGSKVCEICDNGIDDDGDNFIDCYDKECSISAACRNFFLGRDPRCEVRPDSFPPFAMKLKFRSNPDLTNHVNRIIAGDIDGDGRTELITSYAGVNGSGVVTASKVNIFNVPVSGDILDLSKSMNVNVGGGEAASYDDIATADINGDGCAEIFVVTMNVSTSSNFKVVAYDCNGNQIWTNPISFVFHPGLIGLVDFDHDGQVELYSRTQIFDAHTGKLLGANNIDNVNTGIHNGINKGWGMNSNAPIAVDILPASPGLELVAGCRIYGVTINRVAMTATLTLLMEHPQYATRTSRTQSNPTSVADFNQDGFLDVLAVGSDAKYDDNTTIFFWDVQHNSVKKYIDLSGTGDYIKGWKNGAGRISVADVDGDTLMNAMYVSGKYLYALRESATSLDVLWKEPVADETSGFTGCTAFDFNGDGKSEIIYRDENYMHTYTTDATGVTRTPPVRCSSRTQHEYPVVVDVDGDGAAEICVTCSTSNTTNGKDLAMWDQAEIRVYESANVPWQSARKIWNQHAYFVTNVNDNLTIPNVQQLHHLIYSRNAPCRKWGTSRPLNSFLSQAAYLTSSGCPSFLAPNIALIPVSPTKFIDYTPFTDQSDSVQVTFKYRNLGDMAINGMLQISFYDGDPRLLAPLATRLDTKSFLLSGMSPEDTIVTTTNLKSPAHAIDLYIVLNDNGTTIPLDIVSQPDHIIECDYDNFINASIEPIPILLVPELINDNITCIAVPGVPETPDHNGAVNAYVLKGDVRDNTSFNFYWSNGTTAKPIASADYVGPTYVALGPGAYTVYAVHKTLNSSSDPVTIIVGEITSQVDARVILEKEFDNIENPNGELKAIVNDTDNDGVGDPADNFNYAWYDGQEILIGDTLTTSHTLTGLGAGTYSVLVSDKTTGCSDSAYATIKLKETVLGTDEEAATTGVSMYPNPGTEGFTILIENAYRGNVQLQVQSVLGNVMERTFSSHKSNRTLKVPVETHKLKSGVYLVKISLGKETVVKKWTKL